ncbi:hypothetical protein SAMN05444162_0091 [Paenibacillaceae bacterium GAS479]|nr:hypothetical protein SAMN05444162_0091 [Paenibacillaceae bacterium GAS479]
MVMEGRRVPESFEREMIRDYIILTHMETMLQRSLDDFRFSEDILRNLYAMAGQEVMDRITNRQREIRRELASRDIKLLMDAEPQFGAFVYNYKFLYHGYHQEFGMTRDVMRSQISIKFGEIAGDLSTLLKQK